MAKKAAKKSVRVVAEKKGNPGGLFIPAGVLLGLGFGFLYDSVPAGLFIGLGVGFVLFAATEFLRKKRF